MRSTRGGDLASSIVTSAFLAAGLATLSTAAMAQPEPQRLQQRSMDEVRPSIPNSSPIGTQEEERGDVPKSPPNGGQEEEPPISREVLRNPSPRSQQPTSRKAQPPIGTQPCIGVMCR